MDSIKKFFEKKKKDTKFKLVGEGKTLTGPAASHSKKQSAQYVPVKKSQPTSQSRMAGAAALARFDTQGTGDVDWSVKAIKAQAKREMEAEKKLASVSLADKGGSSLGAPPKTTYVDVPPMLAVQGVYFYCSLLGPETDSYDVIRGRIREFLFGQLGEDKGVASCLIIHTCNKNKEKTMTCIETLCKYVENIITNPTEEKYRKIRQSNRAYQERVACLEGTKEFFEAAGFESKEMPFNDSQDTFWVFPVEKLCDLDTVECLRDALVSAEPLKPQLDRSLIVLLPNQASSHNDLPPDFFSSTVEELKREQQSRSETVERNQMLMTKAMREKMEAREIRKYRFSLIRIRFPDGIVLQGTFAVNEKFSTVIAFVRENLTNGWRPFYLNLSGGGRITEENSTLFELRMVPAVLFNFEWDPHVQDPDLNDRIYLKDEIMMLLQTDE